MKICPKCGQRNTSDALFCEECGCDLRGVGVQQEQSGWNNAGQNPIRQGWNDGGQNTLGKGWNGSGGQTPPVRGWSGGGQTPPPAPAPKPPKKPRKKPSKNLIIAAVEAVVLVALIVAFVAVGKARTDPTKVAEHYFLALTQGDWEAICANTEVPDSPFLTEEAFAEAIKQWNPLDGREISQISARRSEDRSSGALEDYLVYVDVEYMLKGESDVRGTTLSLVKGEGRELFFFPQWEVVDYLPVVASNFQVEVPAGATLVVDGLVADESMRTQQGSDRDVYTMDVFVGTHHIQAVTAGMVTQEFDCEVWGSGNYCYACDIAITEEVRDGLVGQAKQQLETLFTAALAQQDVSAVASAYVGDTDGRVSDCYFDLVDYFFSDEDWRVLSVTLDDFEIWSCYTYTENGQVYVSLDLCFNCRYDYANLWNGYLEDTDYFTDYGEFAVTFVRQDSAWLPCTIEYLDY